MNTAVTAQNTAAIAALTAVMAGASGVPAIAAPSAMSVPGLSIPAISAPAAAGAAPAASPVGIALPGIGASGGAMGAGWAANLRASWSNLKSFAGLGNITTDSQGTRWATIGNQSIPLDSFSGWANVIGRSPAAGMAGSMLAMNGLLGSGAGTWRGIMEGTAGGAMLGFQAGGPLGAAIGASIGAEIGLFEKLFGVESPENEAKRLVEQLYSINIDTQMAKQIVSIAQQKYAGHVSIAVRDPDVRKMLMLYSQATGQKMPLSAAAPQSASLAEMGGRLYQQATYVNGMPYTFQSNLPVPGGYATGTYPSPGPMMLQVNVQGQGAAQFVAGQVVTPEFVQAQWSSAAAGSNGRLQNSAVIQQPGLVIA